MERSSFDMVIRDIIKARAEYRMGHQCRKKKEARKRRRKK